MPRVDPRTDPAVLLAAIGTTLSGYRRRYPVAYRFVTAAEWAHRLGCDGAPVERVVDALDAGEPEEALVLARELAALLTVPKVA